MKRKPVITLDDCLLRREMARLWYMVLDAGVQPDGIVGIASGGVHCARKLAGVANVPVMSCAMRRPSTEIKTKHGARHILAHLPYLVTDALRRFEDRKLERSAATQARIIPAPSPQLMQDIDQIRNRVRAERLRALLVVDDAVDSGATLACVTRALTQHLPAETRVISAVLTQTRPNPVFRPMFRLYDGVLCRFPWSNDFRGR